MKNLKIGKIALLLMILILAVSAFGCTKSEDKKDQGKKADNVVISDLNGKPLTFDEFKNMYIIVLNNIIRYNKIKTQEELDTLLSIEITPGVTQDSYIRESALTRIINTNLIRNYMQSIGQSVSESEVTESVNNFKESAQKFAPELLEYYALNNITDEVVKGIFEDSQYVKKFEDLIYEEVKKEYESDSQKLESTALRVEASHILLKTEEEAKAVIERVKKGEDFATLAKELSTDKVSGENGGELGYFGRGAMIKEFSDAAFSMNVGDISEPVKSQFGYHVIKLTGKETYADIKARNSETDDLKLMFDQIVGMEVENRITNKITELSSKLKLDVNYPLIFEKIEIKMPEVKEEGAEPGAKEENQEPQKLKEEDKQEESESKDSKEKTENKEKTESKDKTENKDNKDNKDKTENKENKENKEKTENKDKKN